MNKKIAEFVGIKLDTTGMVIFYEPNHDKKTISELGRTPELPFTQAVDIYAETPNPASQLLQWNTEEEKQAVLTQHELDIHNPEWLEYLFDCI